MKLRLRGAIRTEHSMRDYRLLLKHVTIRAFYNGWRFRKLLRVLQDSVAGLAKEVLSLGLDITEDNYNSFSDRKRDIVQQNDLQAWVDREHIMSKAPLLATELTSRVGHLTDAAHVLTQAIAQGREREEKWRETSTTFFARNSALRDELTGAVKTAQNAVETMQLKVAELARLQVCVCMCLRVLVFIVTVCSSGSSSFPLHPLLADQIRCGSGASVSVYTQQAMHL